MEFAMGHKLKPLLIVISAPSGGGKSVLCRRLLAERKDIAYSISCTTRSPRGEEVNGRDYHFLSETDFERRVKNGEFLEHAVVHGKNYGTLRKPVDDAFAAGKSIIMDIDVEGARQIREYVKRLPNGDALKQAFVDIFIEPPSLEILRQRLMNRAEDKKSEIERRLKTAEQEMLQRDKYRHRIVNDELDRAYVELKETILKEQTQPSC
jgi:guanylate kinase